MPDPRSWCRSTLSRCASESDEHSADAGRVDAGRSIGQAMMPRTSSSGSHSADGPSSRRPSDGTRLPVSRRLAASLVNAAHASGASTLPSSSNHRPTPSLTRSQVPPAVRSTLTVVPAGRPRGTDAATPTRRCAVRRAGNARRGLRPGRWPRICIWWTHRSVRSCAMSNQTSTGPSLAQLTWPTSSRSSTRRRRPSAARTTRAGRRSPAR